MKQMFILGVVMAAMAIPVFANAQMVIVVRHAERADDGASPGTSMAASPDPELSEAGKARALKLAAMLGDAGIVAIYTTEYRRTKNTAAPLAAKAGVPAEVVLARDAAADRAPTAAARRRAGRRPSACPTCRRRRGSGW